MPAQDGLVEPFFSQTGGTLYAQVAGALRQRIRSGIWPPGAQLPTLNVLVKEFGVARVTLRQALGLLEDEGLIWRSRGRGTFVAANATMQWLHVGTSWQELVNSLESNWARPIFSTDVEQVPGLEARDGAPASRYRHLRRVHGRDQSTYALVDLYLDHSVYNQAAERFETEMLIPVMEALKSVEIASARQTLEIGRADRDVATQLGVAIGAPIGIMRRVIISTKGRLLYVGDVTYRGDLVKIEMNLERQDQGTVEPTSAFKDQVGP